MLDITTVYTIVNMLANFTTIFTIITVSSLLFLLRDMLTV